MIVTTVLVKVKKDCVEDFISASISNHEASIKEPGNMRFDILQNEEDETSFILYEAGLSYLGLGIRPPNASWGILLSEGANYLETAPQLLYIPATFFVLTLMSLNFLGDGLRDALDPKSSKD